MVQCSNIKTQFLCCLHKHYIYEQANYLDKNIHNTTMQKQKRLNLYN